MGWKVCLLTLTLSVVAPEGVVLRLRNGTIEPAERLPTLSAEAPGWGVEQLHWREQTLDRAKLHHRDIQDVGVDDGPPDTFAWKNVTVPEEMDYAFWSALCNATHAANSSNVTNGTLSGDSTASNSTSNSSSALAAANATNASGTTNLTVQEVEFWHDFCNSPHGTDELHFWRIVKDKRCDTGVDLPDVMALRDCAEATLAKAECSPMFDFWDDPQKGLPTCRCMAKTASTCQPQAAEAGEGGIFGAARRQ
mmetsp:Transcript_40178/g.90154  ORF Transcript_40178/g.90154 Transcript_40178/m.90154 type:complete len:251 (-) Transcript_40178:23-775(-)